MKFKTSREVKPIILHHCKSRVSPRNEIIFTNHLNGHMIMAYYGRRRYRSWRSRNYGRAYKPSKFILLKRLFGEAVDEIKSAFLNLEDDAVDELLSDYGAVHGEAAERYARNTYPNWKNKNTNLSGQTMERLIELVPPYLTTNQRYDILRFIISRHKKTAPTRFVYINIEDTQPGLLDLKSTLETMKNTDVLAYLPEKVMEAASWLCDDDITVARSILAEAESLENNIIRTKAIREIELLIRTISSGQVQNANYSVEMPAGTLIVKATTPPKSFFAKLFG